MDVNSNNSDLVKFSRLLHHTVLFFKDILNLSGKQQRYIYNRFCWLLLLLYKNLESVFSFSGNRVVAEFFNRRFLVVRLKSGNFNRWLNWMPLFGFNIFESEVGMSLLGLVVSITNKAICVFFEVHCARKVFKPLDRASTYRALLKISIDLSCCFRFRIKDRNIFVL